MRGGGPLTGAAEGRAPPERKPFLRGPPSRQGDPLRRAPLEGPLRGGAPLTGAAEGRGPPERKPFLRAGPLILGPRREGAPLEGPP